MKFGEGNQSEGGAQDFGNLGVVLREVRGTIEGFASNILLICALSLPKTSDVLRPSLKLVPPHYWFSNSLKSGLLWPGMAGRTCEALKTLPKPSRIEKPRPEVYIGALEYYLAALGAYFETGPGPGAPRGLQGCPF